MRNPTIKNYLSDLQVHLAGRLERSQIGELLAETESHLRDLTEDFGGREDQAIARFGSPRKMARRLLRKLEVLPTEREAARWPVIIAVLASIQMTMLPWIGMTPSLAWLFFTSIFVASVMFIYLCFRGRRMLFKSLAILSVGVFVGQLLIPAAISISVPLGGGMYRTMFRSEANSFIQGSPSRLAMLDHHTARLIEGKQFFQGEAKAPSKFRAIGGGYVVPSLVAGIGRIPSASTSIPLPKYPLFIPMRMGSPAGVRSWTGAVQAWQDADRYLALQQSRREAEIHVAANVEKAMSEGPLGYMRIWFLPKVIAGIYSFIVLLYMNFVGWGLSHVYRRITMPPRKLRA